MEEWRLVSEGEKRKPAAAGGGGGGGRAKKRRLKQNENENLFSPRLKNNNPPLKSSSLTSTGNEPAAVSPESITQSVPSSTALATSVASARVGRGFLHIDSSI